MSITVGDVLRVVATMAWTDGNLAQNVFNAVITGSGGPYDDADIVDDAVAWMDDVYANLVGNLSDDCDGSQIQVYLYDDADLDWDEVGTDPWSFDPTSTGEQLPRGVAALINARTTNPDVSGKKYVPAVVENAITDGLWNASFITALGLFAADWYTAFVGSVSTAAWTPAIWSPTIGGPLVMSGAVVVPTIAAYQRRRKRGIGV